MNLPVTDHPSGARLAVRVKPRSSRSSIVKTQDGCLIISLAAPPVDGEANAELIRLLAAAANVAKTTISVTSGAKSRTKLVQFRGLTAEELALRLNPHLAPSQSK